MIEGLITGIVHGAAEIEVELGVLGFDGFILAGIQAGVIIIEKRLDPETHDKGHLDLLTTGIDFG